ncbi:type IV secretion system protein (plasmid) [Roseomonas sp. OT10]|nr:type IV secretion system protein [Roseomonas sp. OT10]UFN51802.1 type IV secretion system protein [Roseomonas sp. OT10]
MLAEATGYTQFGERLVIRGLMGVSFVALVVIFLMWVVARVLMGFVIALGPFLIGLYLFDATRPYVDRWVGKLVSLTLVQVSVSVMLQMLMTGFNTYVRAAQANPGGSLDEKIGAFLQVGAWYWCGLFLIASLTVVAYSIGGGLAASFAPLTQSAAGMTNGAASLAGTGVGAGGKALGRGIGRGVAAGYRRMRSSSNTHAAE